MYMAYGIMGYIVMAYAHFDALAAFKQARMQAGFDLRPQDKTDSIRAIRVRCASP